MSLELYSLINFLAMMIIFAGLILPALIIYFYSSYKNHFALIISVAALAITFLIVGEHIVILLPFILPIIFAGLIGSLLRKYGEEFWLSVGYMIVAVLAGMIIGVIFIYFYYGMQDIAGLLADGFRNVYQNLPPDDEVGVLGINIMTQILLFAQQGIMPEFAEISTMTMTEKLDSIVPLIKEGMASALPSYVMGYGIISGVWAWFISSVMIKKRADAKKPLPGIKEYVSHPPFSDWKMPRWFTNVLMVLLFAAIIISFMAKGEMLNVASALQTVAVVILSIQGLAVVNWWLKKKKVHVALNVLICLIVTILSLLFSRILPFLLFLGFFDIVFSIRVSQKQKEAIIKKMEDIKNQVDKQMHEMQEEQKKEETEDKKDKKDDDKKEDEQDESEEK